MVGELSVIADPGKAVVVGYSAAAAAMAANVVESIAAMLPTGDGSGDNNGGDRKIALVGSLTTDAE